MPRRPYAIIHSLKPTKFQRVEPRGVLKAALADGGALPLQVILLGPVAVRASAEGTRMGTGPPSGWEGFVLGWYRLVGERGLHGLHG